MQEPMDTSSDSSSSSSSSSSDSKISRLLYSGFLSLVIAVYGSMLLLSLPILLMFALFAMTMHEPTFLVWVEVGILFGAMVTFPVACHLAISRAQELYSSKLTWKSCQPLLLPLASIGLCIVTYFVLILLGIGSR